jgi:GPI-anchor transamidase subunit GAA1
MYTGGVPVVLYDHPDPNEGFGGSEAYQFLPSWVPNIVADRMEVKQYVYRATNILRHAGFQARGRPSGVHGLFHQ